MLILDMLVLKSKFAYSKEIREKSCREGKVDLTARDQVRCGEVR